MDQTKPESLSDQELMLQYKATENQNLLSILYQRYAHLVYGVCLKYMGSNDQSEDITMQIFERFVRKIQDTEIASCRNYLFILTKNECLTFLRNKAQSDKKHEKWSDFTKTSPNYVENEAILRHYNEGLVEEPEEVIKKAVAALSAEQQTCIRLFYYQNMTYKQIAKELNTSPLKVKSHLQNAKRKLRNILKPDLYEQ